MLRLVANFGKVTCEPGWKWDLRNQPLTDFDLWYAWSGEGEMSVNGEPPIPVQAGSCFLFRPGDRTYATHDPAKPLTVTFLHFDWEPAVRELMPRRYRRIHNPIWLEAMLNQYVELFYQEEYRIQEEAAMLLKLLLLHLDREDRRELDDGAGDHSRRQLAVRIRETAHWIRQSPGSLHTLAALAERAGLSPRYFSIVFRQIMGETAESFVIRTKVERAVHLLRHNGMNVTEVADALGYANIHFFSKQFKQRTGFTPSQIRAGKDRS